jgi:hypothetical protein
MKNKLISFPLFIEDCSIENNFFLISNYLKDSIYSLEILIFYGE